MSLPKPYYQDEAVTLYHGDCSAILPCLGRFDLLLTDPPYGIGAGKMTMGARSRMGSQHHKKSNWDIAPPPARTIKAACDAATKNIIWGGNYFDLPPSKCWLIWDKVDHNSDFASAELAWTNLQAVVRTFVMSRKAASLLAGHHPTQKPEKLMTWCIDIAGADVQTILDPFAGSGTTGRAAKDLGRKAVLIEREERYCEIAARRMAQEVFAFTETAA